MRPIFPNPHSPTPQIKVCGLTRLADAQACAEHGVAAIGINFWPKSKRFHAFPDASQWLADAPSNLTRVALFVNASREEILPIMKSGLLDTIQFHGDESDEFVQSFLDDGYQVIRALSARSEADLEKISRCPCRAVILDAYAPGIYGGTGQDVRLGAGCRGSETFP